MARIIPCPVEPFPGRRRRGVGQAPATRTGINR
jgi:hypothetical protein